MDWSDDSPNGKEQVSKYDPELMQKIEALEATCDNIGLNRIQKRLLAGELVHNISKYEIIVSWVKTLKGFELSTEDLDERLQLLIG